jgi:hypothetical protein
MANTQQYSSIDNEPPRMLHNRLLQNVSTDFDDSEYQTIEKEVPEQVALAASDYSPVNVKTLKYNEMPV